jgi:hypothetical protein
MKDILTKDCGHDHVLLSRNKKKNLFETLNIKVAFLVENYAENMRFHKRQKMYQV